MAAALKSDWFDIQDSQLTSLKDKVVLITGGSSGSKLIPNLVPRGGNAADLSGDLQLDWAPLGFASTLEPKWSWATSVSARKRMEA